MAGGRRRASGPRPVLDERGARAAALDLLARRAWSTRELAARLRRRGAPAAVATAVTAGLEAQGYLDDRAYARWWAEARARGRKVGSLRLARELRAKGIAPGLTAAAVEAAFAEVPEADRVLEAGRRRLSALSKTRPERLHQRLHDHLLRRGYPPDVVREVVRRLLGSEPDEAGDR